MLTKIYYRFLRFFSPRKNKRAVRFFFQRLVRGFDDADTWSLDCTIAKFVLPRLKRFKELNDCFPNGLSKKEWNKKLDVMISTFEMLSKGGWEIETKEEQKKIQHGLELFARYYIDLWW